MNKEEKKNKENELDYLYNNSLSEAGELDTSSIMGGINDFIDDEYVEHDFESEMLGIYTESKEVIGNMSALYLDENEELIENPYIQKKIQSDAQNLADMTFLQNIAKMAIVKQMKQIEQGDVTPRHFETLYGGMKEIRENIKQATVTVNTMEGFYKELRDDLGLKEQIGDISDDSGEKKNIVDQKNLNMQLEEILKNRKKKNLENLDDNQE